MAKRARRTSAQHQDPSGENGTQTHFATFAPCLPAITKPLPSVNCANSPASTPSTAAKRGATRANPTAKNNNEPIPHTYNPTPPLRQPKHPQNNTKSSCLPLAKLPHTASMKTLLALAFTATSILAAQPATTPAEAFATIKKFAGEWHGPAAMKGMPASHSIYRITAGGSAVEEIIFPGTKMEMISMYHMDGSDLLMTHYCVIGNQPRMKFNPSTSTPTELVFDFDGGTNFNKRRDQHMHSAKYTITPGKSGPQKITQSGTSWKDGKPAESCGAVTMTRRK